MLMCVLAGAVCAAILVPSSVTTVRARAYGKKKKYGYGPAIARCSRGCSKTNSTLEACRRRLLHGAKAQCQRAFKAELGSCTGSKSSCKKKAHGDFKGCLGDFARQVKQDRARAKPGGCTKCCRKSKGGGDCLNYLSDSRFSGSAKYGRRLNCVDSYAGNPEPGPGPNPTTSSSTTSTTRPPPAGSPGGAFVDGVTDQLRARAIHWMRALVRRAA